MPGEVADSGRADMISAEQIRMVELIFYLFIGKRKNWICKKKNESQKKKN